MSLNNSCCRQRTDKSLFIGFMLWAIALDMVPAVQIEWNTTKHVSMLCLLLFNMTWFIVLVLPVFFIICLCIVYAYVVLAKIQASIKYPNLLFCFFYSFKIHNWEILTSSQNQNQNQNQSSSWYIFLLMIVTLQLDTNWH